MAPSHPQTAASCLWLLKKQAKKVLEGLLSVHDARPKANGNRNRSSESISRETEASAKVGSTAAKINKDN